VFAQSGGEVAGLADLGVLAGFLILCSLAESEYVQTEYAKRYRIPGSKENEGGGGVVDPTLLEMSLLSESPQFTKYKNRRNT
jgi:hypothetical protein